MGVYIPNMSKPKDCKKCQWHLDFYIEDEQVGGLCTITEKDDKENTCPLIEIDLVRCGECKWWESAKNGWNGWCRKQIDAYATFYAEDFCSYGERKSDEN